MNRQHLAAAALLGLTLLTSGCSNVLKPLDYHAERAYVPVTLDLGAINNRFDEQRHRQMIGVLKDTGAFSMLDGGYSRSGYSLLIREPYDGGPNYLGLLNVFTLFTFPMPYHYKDNLRGQVYKDGELLKTYNYSREGWSALAWYVPLPSVENRRLMLDQLMNEMDKDKVIPYQP